MRKTILLGVIVISLVSCKSKPSAENAGAGNAGVAAVESGISYAVDTTSSTINWKGSKPGGEHTGIVSISEGSVNVEGGKIVSGSFIIDLNSIVDQDLTDAGMNAKLIGHLKSPDFFDVAKYPTAKFELVEVSELSEAAANSASHQVTGNLTMKDVTKSISFPATIKVSENSVTATAAPFSVNRTEWGVNYGSKSIFAELKDKFINDEIVLTLNLSFNKK